MQGRLVPPIGRHGSSASRAELGRRVRRSPPQAGLDAIEWIYDQFGADVNPLATDAASTSMRASSDQHGVAVASVCADYFMDWPLVRATPMRARGATRETCSG